MISINIKGFIVGSIYYWQNHFFFGDAMSSPKSKNLWYNLKAGQDKTSVKKKLGVHFGRNYNGSAKAKLRLWGIFFTASTHTESIVLLQKSVK